MRTPSAARVRYMARYEAEVLRLDPTAAGKVDWDNAIYAFVRNPDNALTGGTQDAETAARTAVARGIHRRAS